MSLMRLRGARVVVRADLPGEKIGLIIVPDIARKQPLSGEIVLVGDRVTEVCLGQRVLFPSTAWSRFPELGFPHMLLWVKDLMAIIEDDISS